MATGWAEEDGEVIRLSARQAQYLDAAFVVKRGSDVRQADWRILIEEAERIDAKRQRTGARQRPTQSSLEYFDMLLGDSNLKSPDEWSTMISAVAQRAQFLHWSGWNAGRLELLRRILNILRRESKTDKSRVMFRIPQGDPEAAFPTSIRSIYRAIWHELYRRYNNEPSFHELVKRHPGHSKLLEGVVDSVIDDWVVDEKGDFGAWPLGTREHLSGGPW